MIGEWQEKSSGHTSEQVDRLNSSKIEYIIIVMYMLQQCDTISFYCQHQLE